MADTAAAKSRRTILASLTLEALIWYGAAAAFLFVYVERYAAPAGAVLAHLELLTLFVAGLALLRLAIWRWPPGPRAARWLCALLLASALTLVLAYYALVITSLHSWGRVITWNLIWTYAAHGLDFAAALGYPAWAVGAAVAALLAVLAALVALLAASPGWTSVLLRGRKTPLVSLAVLSGFALVGLRLYAFAIDPPAHAGEPLSLTFYPDRVLQFRNNRTGDSPLLDAAEAAAREAYTPSPDFQRRNVILIVGDALRPDRMGIYGHARPTTPHLEQWAAGAALRRFDRVWAACAESACGLLAIANSRYVFELPRGPFSLMEALRRHGYAVHMILGGDHTNFYGLREAYGPLDSYSDGSSATGHYMNDDALVVERAAALPDWDGRPVMIQFHLMSSHELGRRSPEALRFQPSESYWRRVLRYAQRHGPDERAINFYDNGVVQFDLVADRILEQLRRKGYLAEALVVVTADHGEMLGEHGAYGHGKSLHEQEVRVPLLLLSFGYRPATAADPGVIASQVDIAPTILAELGIPRPATWTGKPLQERPAREVLHFQEETQIGLLDLRESGQLWKYWTDLRTGEEFAYDLAADPAESRNMLERAPPGKHRDWRRRISVVAVSAAR